MALLPVQNPVQLPESQCRRPNMAGLQLLKTFECNLPLCRRDRKLDQKGNSIVTKTQYFQLLGNTLSQISMYRCGSNVKNIPIAVKTIQQFFMVKTLFLFCCRHQHFVRATGIKRCFDDSLKSSCLFDFADIAQVIKLAFFCEQKF